MFQEWNHAHTSVSSEHSFSVRNEFIDLLRVLLMGALIPAERGCHVCGHAQALCVHVTEVNLRKNTNNPTQRRKSLRSENQSVLMVREVNGNSPSAR